MRRLASLLVVLTLIVSIGLAVILTPRADDLDVPAGRQSPGASQVVQPTTSPATPAVLPGPIRYGERGTRSPSETSQSRIWFADGSWWGVFLNGDSGHRIYRLGGGGEWLDTGTVVDERPFARPDVQWDGAALIIASAGPEDRPGHHLRVTRYSYDPATETYTRDANFPVQLTQAGVGTPTIARSADGRLWVAYLTGGGVALDHTVESDLAWRGPFVPTLAGGPVESAVIAAIADRVALVWTRGNEDSVFVVTHTLRGVPDQWEAGTAAAVPSLSQADTRLHVTVDNSPGGERLFVTLTTGVAEVESAGRRDPNLIVVEHPLRTPPRVHLVGRVEDQHVSPISVIDVEGRLIHVIAASPRGGGSIYRKTASLDDLLFPSGEGEVTIAAGPGYPRLSSPSSTKQAVDASTGFVVSATDSGAGIYAFAAVGVRLQSDSRPSQSASGQTTLVEQTFDGLRIGATVTGWTLDEGTRFDVASLTGVNSSARLGASSSERAEACLPVAGTALPSLSIEADVLLSADSTDDVDLLSLRGEEGELVAVRVRAGELSYFDGADRVRTDLFIEPSTWYRVSVQLDVANGSYNVSIVSEDTGEPVLAADGVSIRSESAGRLSRLCAEVPAQAGLDMYLDDVRVVAEP